MKIKLSPYFALLAIVAACSNGPESVSEAKNRPSARQIIELNDLQTGKIRPEAMTESFKASARIEAPPQSTAHVYPIIGAFVNDVYVIKGQKVVRGERLAALSHPDLLALQEKYLSARIALERTRQDYTRKQELIQDQAVSKKELQASAAAYRSAKSETQSLESTLRNLGLNPDRIAEGELAPEVYLLAPLPGHILSTRAGVGQYAGTDSPLFSIVNNEHLHLELQVPPSEIGKMKKGMPVKFHTRTHEGAITGEIYLVNEVADEDGFFNAHAHFPDTIKDLRPGTYAEAEVIYRADTIPALPAAAVFSRDAVQYVLALESDSLVKIAVTTGLSNQQFVSILDADKLAGKELVLNGVKYLLSDEGAAGHSH